MNISRTVCFWCAVALHSEKRNRYICTYKVFEVASNKHAQVRYKVLDDCFSNFHRKFYFKDLLDPCNEALKELYGDNHLGIKTRSLRNDINYIRTLASESGVKVEAFDDGSGFYYRYSEPDFSIFKRGLGEDDLAQLKETVMMLQRFKGMPNFDWISELVVKLEDRLDLRGVSKSVVGYEENNAYTGLDWFQDLFNSIINRCVLHIQYKTFSDVDHNWIIHPYYIKEYNNRWFLFGFNENKNKISNLALDRIEDIEQVNKEYLPSSIKFETYFNDVVGVTISDAHIICIRLQFSVERFYYALTKPLHQSQHIKDINNRIIEISVIPNKELDALILSFGKDVEVLSPESYREHIVDMIKQTYEKYTPVQIDCTGRF